MADSSWKYLCVSAAALVIVPVLVARAVIGNPELEMLRKGQAVEACSSQWMGADEQTSCAPAKHGSSEIQLCQCAVPYGPAPVPAVDCGPCGNCGPGGWRAMGPAAFDLYGPGEYVARARTQHVPEYRLRVDDQLEFVYRVTRNESRRPYQINVGDKLIVESATDKDLKYTLIVQPDGTITLPLLGQVRATRHTIEELRSEIENGYQKHYRVPAITVTPLRVNTKLEDLRYTIGGRSGLGGQTRPGRVTPDGTVSLPAVGSVPAQGLTLDEFTHELAERYAEEVDGIEVIPVLALRAPRYVYVLGEVKEPGRYPLEGPTTVMQALALAGSWNVGANIEQVVVFRRADDWHLVATMLDLRGALLGKQPCPAGEIWVSDADLVIVPKSKILRCDNFIELVFTKGLYGVFPFSGSVSYTNLSTL